MMLFYFLMGAALMVTGFAVHVLKWHFLISGYNTMPKEKKAKVDAEGLGRLIGIYSYVNGGVFIGMGLLHAFGFKATPMPAIVFFCLTSVFLLIKAQKYDGNIYDEQGKLRPGAWKQLVVPVSIVIVVLIFVVVLLLSSAQPAKVTLNDGGVQIHGMYGDRYAWESIKAVKLLEQLPAIEAKTNGSAVGSHLKGYFRTKELGSVKLFVDAQQPPFIYLETDDGMIIFNMGNEDETRSIFHELQAKTEQL